MGLRWCAFVLILNVVSVDAGKKLAAVEIVYGVSGSATFAGSPTRIYTNTTAAVVSAITGVMSKAYPNVEWHAFWARPDVRGASAFETFVRKLRKPQTFLERFSTYLELKAPYVDTGSAPGWAQGQFYIFHKYLNSASNSGLNASLAYAAERIFDIPRPHTAGDQQTPSAADDDGEEPTKRPPDERQLCSRFLFILARYDMPVAEMRHALDNLCWNMIVVAVVFPPMDMSSIRPLMGDCESLLIKEALKDWDRLMRPEHYLKMRLSICAADWDAIKALPLNLRHASVVQPVVSEHCAELPWPGSGVSRSGAGAAGVSLNLLIGIGVLIAIGLLALAAVLYSGHIRQKRKMYSVRAGLFIHFQAVTNQRSGGWLRECMQSKNEVIEARAKQIQDEIMGRAPKKKRPSKKKNDESKRSKKPDKDHHHKSPGRGSEKSRRQSHEHEEEEDDEYDGLELMQFHLKKKKKAGGGGRPHAPSKDLDTLTGSLEQLPNVDLLPPKPQPQQHNLVGTGGFTRNANASFRSKASVKSGGQVSARSGGEPARKISGSMRR